MRESPCAPDGKKRERRSLMEQAKDWRKTKQYRELKKSMLDNLEARGLLEKAYTDKVDEYLDFWVRRQELQTDVAERGLSVMDDRGRITENRSVSLEIQVARQMLAVWTALGFKDAAAKSDVPGGMDDEL
nr:MAG TPA: terminase small subunit [Caudoviricetes sp.]